MEKRIECNRKKNLPLKRSKRQQARQMGTKLQTNKLSQRDKAIKIAFKIISILTIFCSAHVIMAFLLCTYLMNVRICTAQESQRAVEVVPVHAAHSATHCVYIHWNRPYAFLGIDSTVDVHSRIAQRGKKLVSDFCLYRQRARRVALRKPDFCECLV